MRMKLGLCLALAPVALGREACEPGQYTAGEACQPCAAGTYAPAAGATSCLPAPAGTFAAAGSAEATLCAAGSSSGEGATACSTCEQDTFASLSGSSSCAACPAGSSAEAGASTCLLAATSAGDCDGGTLTTMVALSNDASTVTTDLGETAFNAAFCKCGVVRYTRNGATHSVYKRTAPVPEGFNPYEVFTYTWSSSGNALGTDFEIYNTCADLGTGEGAWTSCNYDDPDVGYPRDCGGRGNEWFSMPGDRFNARGISSGASFELVTTCDAGPGGPGCEALATTTTTTTAATTTTTTSAASEALSSADSKLLSSGVVADATAKALSAGDRLGWHMNWDPKSDPAAEKLVAEICSGASQVCKRYVYILHECYPECEDKLRAAGELRGPDPDIVEVGMAGVESFRADQTQAQEEWEHCLTDCAVRPSCSKMCGTDTEGCLPKCYTNYKPMVKSIEALYVRVHNMTFS